MRDRTRSLQVDLRRPSKRSRVYLVTDSMNVSTSQGLGLGLGLLNKHRTFANRSGERLAN